MKKLLLIILPILLVSACSSSGFDREQQNRMIKTFYANVQTITPIQLSSQVEGAAATGAVIGITENVDGNGGDMIAGGVIGALFGGIFTSILEGGNDAFQYELSSSTEGNFSVVQKDKVSHIGGCVLVKQSDKLYLEAVDSRYCEEI